MNEELLLKVQSYVDGELSAAEARDVEKLIASDVEARDLAAELRNTRAAVAGFAADLKLPESREFYWSKISREIERLENTGPASSEESLLAKLRRFLIPAGAVAAVLIAILAVQPQFAGQGGQPEFETTLDDAVALTYRNHDSGATLVWLAFPAENEFADMDTDDTL